MELTLAILMVLGIFVGIPLVLVLAIGGIYALSGRLAERAKRVEAMEAFGEVSAQAQAPEELGDWGLAGVDFNRLV